MFHCVLQRKVDVRVVLMLFCKPWLRPGFSRIDEKKTLYLFSDPFHIFLSCSFLSCTVLYDCSRRQRRILYIYLSLVF